MAKIIDPDQLNQGTEVVIDTTLKTLRLLEAGNLDNTSPGSTSGVAMQALYSFFKNEWMTDASLNKFRFPQTAIYEASFIMINDWEWFDQDTKNLIRDAGWQEVDGSEYAAIISLGGMVDDQNDLAYYQQITGFDQTSAAFDKTGPLNEPVKIYDGSGTPNYRGFFKAFIREQGKTFDQYNLLLEQNITALTYAAYRLPLSNSLDININFTDLDIETDQPFTSMQVQYYPGTRFEVWDGTETYIIGDVVESSGRWYQCIEGHTNQAPPNVTYWEAYAGEKQVGENYYAFNREVRGNIANQPTRYEIYAFTQYKLRQTTDINDDPDTLLYGTVNGNIANPFCFFVGGNLWGEPGVWFQNFNANDTNDITLQSIDAAPAGTSGVDDEDLPKDYSTRVFPFVSAGNLVFNVDLVNDADAKYWMYFQNAGGNQFDTANAIIVEDDEGTPITGDITSGTIPFTFDYDNNTQGGRTAAADAAVVVVAMGLNNAQWVLGSFTITRAVGLNFPVNAPTERNYIGV
jgi:hypothetical protein